MDMNLPTTQQGERTMYAQQANGISSLSGPGYADSGAPAPAFVAIDQKVQGAYGAACDVLGLARRIQERLFGPVPQNIGQNEAKNPTIPAWTTAVSDAVVQTRATLDEASAILNRIANELG
jgi:hypothetical protein